MPRILAIDYGTKRSGLATTDPLQIIATALDVVATRDLWEYLKEYMQQEEVEAIVIGQPTHADGAATAIAPAILGLTRKLQKTYPHLAIHQQDEAYSSAEAAAVIIASGVKKHRRRDKGLVDKVSAVIILQRFLGHV